MERPVEQLLLEYQDYILAYRLKRQVGGKLSPKNPKLTLPEYARMRLHRMELARKLVSTGMQAEEFSELDDLTDQMNYGFWYNPRYVSEFLHAVLFAGRDDTFVEEQGFLRLLSPTELQRLGTGTHDLYRKYSACFRLATPGVDPLVLERIYEIIEKSHVPLFIDELQ